MIGLGLAAVAITGCGKDPSDDATPISNNPLPAFPAWAQPLIGTVARAPTAQGCLGNFDLITSRHTESPSGLQVEGWGWIGSRKIAPDHIIFTQTSGKIVGAGQTDWDRPDVPKAIPSITTPHVGWHGAMTVTEGKINVLALMADNSTCLLGVKDLGAR